MLIISPMAINLYVAVAMGLYVVVSRLIWRNATGNSASKITSGTAIRLLAAVAVCLHALHLYALLYPGGGYINGHGALNLALGNAVSLVAWMSVVLFLLASMIKQTLSLGIIVMPWGLLGLMIGWLAPGEIFLLEELPHGIGQHIAIAIPAYGVLSIAFAQAIILWIQEQRLRKPNPGRFFPALPALETMESNLRQLTLLGFALLTVNLITGMLNTRQNYGALLLFNHHILLALLAWGGFGGLLLGRKIFGWRGRITARWTIIAFVILALAYFGTRFVSDVILST